MRALAPAEGQWGVTEELLAQAIEGLGERLDVVAVFVNGLARMFAQRPGQPYKPKPLEIPRPDGIGTAGKPRGTTMGELRAMLKLQRAARETAPSTPPEEELTNE